MKECNPEMLRTVPLVKVVAAAIIDTHEDVGKVQQTYLHWAARGLKKLVRESLDTGIRKVLLQVNTNTKTATLPPDFDTDVFVGIISGGRKIRLKPMADLVDEMNITNVACEDVCPRCNQDKNICNELKITEETEVIVVNGEPAVKTIVKKMNPDGSYYVETTIPVWDTETNGITYTKTKEYVAHIDLKPCGCPDDSIENVKKIESCCHDIYCKYYMPCDNNFRQQDGGYKIFPETGLIYVDNEQIDKLYLEYRGFLVKKNGQYHVPEVAFETLVNWVKFKNVENRKSVSLSERQWYFEQYLRERKNMSMVLGKIGLDTIFRLIGMTPKFDIDCEPYAAK